MSVNTRSQNLAQKAYTCVEKRKNGKTFSDYVVFAKKFPALIHTCGLAQAAAFAEAKRKKDQLTGGVECEYLGDLASVLNAGGHGNVADANSLTESTRKESVTTYLRLSRDAIDAAVWLKRYAEALSTEATDA